MWKDLGCLSYHQETNYKQAQSRKAVKGSTAFRFGIKKKSEIMKTAIKMLIVLLVSGSNAIAQSYGEIRGLIQNKEYEAVS